MLGMFLSCLFFEKTMQTVHAEETRFEVEARLLPSDGGTYDIQLTIETGKESCNCW